jgi:Peptidase family S51
MSCPCEAAEAGASSLASPKRMLLGVLALLLISAVVVGVVLKLQSPQVPSLADLLPELGRETVYVGLSAGSMVMAPSIGEDFVGWKPPTGGDRTLGLVDFAMFPHLDNPSAGQFHGQR